MKGGFHTPRGLRLPFIVFALFGMTIFMWGWEKTPLPAALFPPYGPFFRLSPGLFGSSLTSIPPEKQIHVDINPLMFARNETSGENAGQSVEMGMLANSTGEVESAKSQKKPVHVDNIQPSFGRIEKLDKSAGKPVDMGIQTDAGKPVDMGIQADVAPGRINESNDEGLHSDDKISEVTQETVDAAVPVNTPNASSIVGMKNGRNLTKQVTRQNCNYAKGKWVADDRRPFYSGSLCKKWLSEMWACRLRNRTDFSFEKFRWQPQDCEMEEFEGAKFLERMQDKTLAFIGDSLGRQQFQSLMCMITGGEERPDVVNVGWEYGLVKARGHVRPDGWAYRFPDTNTTIVFYWSACLCDLEPLNATSDPTTTEYAMHLDRPPAFLRRFLPRFDIVVLNTGHHWNIGKLTANRWVMHVGGVKNTDPKIADIGGAKNLTIHSIVQWVDSQLPKHPSTKAFYRTISPRHFLNGDWNTGGTCDNTNPLSKGSEVVQDESIDSVPAMAVKGTKVKLLDITALSQLRDEGHISKYSIRPSPGMQDCLHWCLPGIPDTWNEIVFAEL
ncbi:Protein trichome birefringence-like 16, variant 2 [Dionaea muscipula]